MTKTIPITDAERLQWHSAQEFLEGLQHKIAREIGEDGLMTDMVIVDMCVEDGGAPVIPVAVTFFTSQPCPLGPADWSRDNGPTLGLVLGAPPEPREGYQFVRIHGGAHHGPAE